MKDWIFLIAGCFFISSLFSQSNNDFFQDTTKRVNIDFNVNYNYGSAGVNNQFLNKFIFGGKIERELKDQVYTELSEKNRLGGDLNYSLNCLIPFDSLFNKNSLSLLVGVENVSHADASFTDDLFKFIFDGNKQFAGKEIDISGVNFNSFDYQQVNLGLIKRINKKETIVEEGVVLSLIKAQSHQAITIPKGSLFTDELGKELILDLNYNYNSTDTIPTDWLTFNGYGISTDLFTEFLLKNGDKIRLEISDLGFVYFNSQPMEIITDSIFRFEGIEVDNIFDLNDSLLEDISRDGITDNIDENKKTENYSIALPTSFNIGYTKSFNQKWKLNLGGYYKILANYFPLIYTNTYFYINPAIALKAHVSYGGYGRLNTGLGFATSIKKSIDIYVGTNNLETFIAPASSYAASGFVGVKVRF